jgi:general secretion pathway protein G
MMILGVPDKIIGCFFNALTAKDVTNAGRRKKSLGFTLIEIMIAISICGLLAAIATPFFIRYRERARVAVAISELKTIETALYNYATTNDGFPDTLAQIGFEQLRDPWGNTYQYLPISGGDKKGKGNMRKDHFLVPVNSDFDLYSKGKDGASAAPFTAKASQDDIVRAFNGAYLGKVADM